MNEGIITVRYAKALYELAGEEKVLDPVLNDIKTIQTIIDQSAEFSAFLENPLIKESQKRTLIETIFKKSIQSLSLRFLNMLIENKRESFLPGICRYFIHLYKESQGINEAVIITAQPLDDKHRKDVFEVIGKKFRKNIELTERVDPAIIGGFILRIEDHQVNASLQAQLNKIKRELINS